MKDLRLIAEEKYLEVRGYDSNEYEIVTWAESQDYMGYGTDGENDVYLINDDEGLELFGGSAYIIPKGLEPFEEDFEDELDNMSEDEVRDLCSTLNENVTELQEKLNEAKKLLTEVLEVISMGKFEIGEDFGGDEIEEDISKFLSKT